MSTQNQPSEPDRGRERQSLAHRRPSSTYGSTSTSSTSTAMPQHLHPDSQAAQPQTVRQEDDDVKSPSGLALDAPQAQGSTSAAGGGSAGGEAGLRNRTRTSESGSRTRREKARAWYSTWIDVHNPTLELANKGSVARDHLANERTFLAWLRTSLSLASIGIAITQLFRLSATLERGSPSPSDPSSPSSSSSSSTSPAGAAALASTLSTLSAHSLERRQSSSEEVSVQTIIALAQRLSDQLSTLDDIEKVLQEDRQRYQRLGKPVGGTFIVLGLLVLVIGVTRYFRVQTALTADKFPPSRRAVLVSAVSVAALVVAAFASILAVPRT